LPLNYNLYELWQFLNSNNQNNIISYRNQMMIDKKKVAANGEDGYN